MAKLDQEKSLMWINFIIVLYFLSIYLIYLFEIDFFAIGVARELLTIPFLLAQFAFLFIGAKRFFANEKISILYGLSFGLLFICAILTVGSFFVQ